MKICNDLKAIESGANFQRHCYLIAVIDYWIYWSILAAIQWKQAPSSFRLCLYSFHFANRYAEANTSQQETLDDQQQKNCTQKKISKVNLKVNISAEKTAGFDNFSSF